ncbi:hypothetical protein SAMN05446927_5380 [Caballeronia arationis]|uniref:Uncharacterized protein n=1 Tax=Caballeronia arationis TaxID=1777142 RepID=A0A7Z7N4I0_9BURK|nr:hypothetical protein SAMN05446927_5380 [Caballeronia arationis]
MRTGLIRRQGQRRRSLFNVSCLRRRSERCGPRRFVRRLFSITDRNKPAASRPASSRGPTVRSRRPMRRSSTARRRSAR